jgi:hypothetical protein
MKFGFAAKIFVKVTNSTGLDTDKHTNTVATVR